MSDHLLTPARWGSPVVSQQPVRPIAVGHAGGSLSSLIGAFIAAMKNVPDTPTAEEWKAARVAYARIKDALSKDDRDELWLKVKAAQLGVRAGAVGADHNPYLVFDRYARIRTRLYQRTDEYREKRSAYGERPEVRAKDRARAKDPKRKEQIQAAKKRHRAKKKAERTAKEA